MRAGNSVPNRCKLRILSVEFISETVGDKLHCQEGNSPDHQLRPLKIAKCERWWECIDNQEVCLEAAIL